MSGGPPGSMSTTQPHSDQQPLPTDNNWDGDKMFNIYIYDYCNKRGFSKTARELQHEAEIPPDSSPPIDAKQGLLYEWWSVFWVLFTAKNNGSGPEEAMIYTQHQIQQANMRSIRQNQTTQMNRMMNGSTPGSMPNGAHGPMYPMPTSGPQPNGIPIPSGAPTPAGANPSQPQNFAQLVHGQRPGGPHHRGSNGVNPYQSPTMAHSPQNPATNHVPTAQHSQPPMGQLGPSPHMPQITQPRMHQSGSSMGAVPSTQASSFGRPPSRSATPSGMMQPSPSFVARQPPTNRELQLNAELNRLPQGAVNALKQELNMGDKDLHSLSLDDKERIFHRAQLRVSAPLTQAGRKPGVGLHGPPGPSNPGQGMLQQGQRPGQAPQQQMPPQMVQQPRIAKRNSTSPPEEGSLPNNESSPPDRKRVRRSPVGMDQPSMPQYPHPQPQPQPGAVGPQPMPNGAMMRQGPMVPGPINNFPHGMAGNPGMTLPLGAPSMGGAMSSGMGSQSGNTIMGYRQGMHMLTKNMAPGPLGANIPGGGTPTPGDPANPGQAPPGAFAGPPNSRITQNKQPTNMMPPPSPAGGPPKEQPKDGNKPPGAPNGASHVDGSPQSQPPNPPQPGAQGPPSASNTQGSTAPPTPNGTNSSFTAPSPSGVNGTPTMIPAVQPTSNAMPDVPSNFMSNEFMQTVANTLEEFDPQVLFRPDDGIDFEHDFRDWFNPGDMEGMRND